MFVFHSNRYLHFFKFLFVFLATLQVSLAPGQHAEKHTCSFATRHAKNFRVSLISVASSIHVLSLQRHWHGLARCALPQPLGSTTPGHWRLVQPCTTGPLTFKISYMVLAMWWPPRPQDLSGQPHTHITRQVGPFTSRQASMPEVPPRLPATMVRKESCPDSDHKVMQLASLLL